MKRLKVFVTGLTGTLGTALAQLHRERGDAVSGCARSEDRAVRWMRKNPALASLFLADAVTLCDRASPLGYVLSSVDRVYHCAALKHVDLCEANPHEAFLQNVHRTSLIAEACKREGTQLVFVSSDKACQPASVYGATKLLGERAVLSCGGGAARLGNLIGSSGSVFQKWAESGDALHIELTDPDMTRFFMTAQEAAIILADRCKPGELTIPRLKAVRMGDVAERIAFLTNRKVKVVGRRPGEIQYQRLDDLLDAPENRWSRSETAPRWDVDDLLRAAGVLKGSKPD